MFKFWKKKQEVSEQEPDVTEQFMNSVISHTIDRRNHTRVRYPEAKGALTLPHFHLGDKPFYPANLSIGGALLVAPPLPKALVGTSFNLSLYWPGYESETLVTAELVGLRQKNWHFKFAEPKYEYETRFLETFDSGIRGAQARKFDQHEFPEGEHILEFWLSRMGDFISFSKVGAGHDEAIKMCLKDRRVQFEYRNGDLVGYVAIDKELRDQLTLYLSNFKGPTARIKNLTRLMDLTSSRDAA